MELVIWWKYQGLRWRYNQTPPPHLPVSICQNTYKLLKIWHYESSCLSFRDADLMREKQKKAEERKAAEAAGQQQSAASKGKKWASKVRAIMWKWVDSHLWLIFWEYFSDYFFLLALVLGLLFIRRVVEILRKDIVYLDARQSNKVFDSAEAQSVSKRLCFLLLRCFQSIFLLLLHRKDKLRNDDLIPLPIVAAIFHLTPTISGLLYIKALLVL